MQKSASSRAFDIHSVILVLADDAPLGSMSSQPDVALWVCLKHSVSSSLVLKIFLQYEESHVTVMSCI